MFTPSPVVPAVSSAPVENAIDCTALSFDDAEDCVSEDADPPGDGAELRWI
jgi:hypothetical protein